MPGYRQFSIIGGSYGSAEKKTFAFANPQKTFTRCLDSAGIVPVPGMW
jgi:hypothetical protein